MSETWYKISRYSTKIEPVAVLKFTEKTVTLAATKYSGERRSGRDNSWDSYYPTWAEAHAAMLARAEMHLAQARRELQRAQDDYGNVKGLTPPASTVLPT